MYLLKIELSKLELLLFSSLSTDNSNNITNKTSMDITMDIMEMGIITTEMECLKVHL